MADVDDAILFLKRSLGEIEGADDGSSAAKAPRTVPQDVSVGPQLPASGRLPAPMPMPPQQRQPPGPRQPAPQPAGGARPSIPTVVPPSGGRPPSQLPPPMPGTSQKQAGAGSYKDYGVAASATAQKGGQPPGFPPMPMPGMMAMPGTAPGSIASQAPGPGTVSAKATSAGGTVQVQFNIPQAKVALVIGTKAQTIMAIKKTTKAQCSIEQKTPTDDLARVTVAGDQPAVEECKRIIQGLLEGKVSLVNGSFQEEGGGSRGQRQAHAMPPAPPQAPQMGMQMGMGGFGGMQMPPAPEPFPPPMQPTEVYNQQQQWWAQYTSQMSAAQKDRTPAGDIQAFDKDALARLAQQASEAPPAAPYQAPPQQYQTPVQETHQRSDFQSLQKEVRQMSGQERIPGQPPKPVSFSMGGGELPPVQKKDADSVNMILQRMQGNVVQTQQANKVAGAFEVAAMRQRSALAKQAFEQAFPEDQEAAAMLQAGGYAMPSRPLMAPSQSGLSPAEFDDITSRVQTAVAGEEIERIAREVLTRFNSFSPVQMTELLNRMDTSTGLCQAGGKQDFLAELGRLLIHRLREFTSSQLTSLTSTFATWATDPRGDRRRQGKRFTDFAKAFFNSASSEMTQRLMDFQPHELNCCLAAFVSVGFSDTKFFCHVSRAALARHVHFAPVQLVALLAILSEMRLVYVDLFISAASFLTTRIRELRPVDVMRALRSFAKCNVQHEAFCRAVGEEVVRRLVEANGNDCGFKCEDLCEISWALCVLQAYHHQFFHQVFRALEGVAMIANDALCQIYECHLALDGECRQQYREYGLDPDGVHALQEHYREHRKDERRCSEKTRKDVTSALEALVDGNVHANHRTSIALLCDVAATRSRKSSDGFVHIEIDSQHTIVRSLENDDNAPPSMVVEGPVALRRRILTRRGLRLVIVKEDEWKGLSDSKERRRHLRGVLQATGDVLD